MLKTFEAGGKTVEEAIDNALLLANTTIENVDIEVLELGGRGVFGFGKKDARVRISLETEEPAVKPANKGIKQEVKPPQNRGRRAEDKLAANQAEDNAPVIKEMVRARATETAKPGRERNRAKESARTDAAKKPANNERGHQVAAGEEAAALTREAMAFLTPIFRGLKVQPQQEAQVKDGILWLVFSGQGLGSLIGRRGETLNSLQYLTNLAVNRDKKEHVRLVLDVEGYRAGREETLVALAKKMAEKAYRTGRRVELEPMNPHERRIVHIALQNDKRVDTASQGEEPFRRVVIHRRRSEQNGNNHHNRRRNNNKGEAAAEKLSLSQQLGQQFSEQMEQRH